MRKSGIWWFRQKNGVLRVRWFPILNLRTLLALILTAAAILASINACLSAIEGQASLYSSDAYFAYMMSVISCVFMYKIARKIYLFKLGTALIISSKCILIRHYGRIRVKLTDVDITTSRLASVNGIGFEIRIQLRENKKVFVFKSHDFIFSDILRVKRFIDGLQIDHRRG